MSHHTVTSAILGALMVLAAAGPAAAQGPKVDFAAGYQFLSFLGEDENVPTGWGISFAGGSSARWKAVGDFGGHYEDGAMFHAFQGGLEIAGNKARVIPFGRVLAGLGVFSGGGDSESVFLFTPEAGVRFMGSGRVGAQVTVGFPILFDEGESLNTLRLFVGVVYSGR